MRAAATDQDVLEAEGGLLEGQGRLVQWYPGHIARAERRLQEQLSQVDAVLEVRDARCALSAVLIIYTEGSAGSEPCICSAAALMPLPMAGTQCRLMLRWRAWAICQCASRGLKGSCPGGSVF